MIFPTLVLLVTFAVIPAFIQFSRKNEIAPPWSVRLASYTELIWGLISLLAGPLIVGDALKNVVPRPWLTTCSLLGTWLGMSWIVLSSHIFNGSGAARRILLFLSIARLLTLAGIIPTLISLVCLYATRSASRFFDLCQPDVDIR